MTATPLEGATAVDGAKVRALRLARGLSRAELAVKASEVAGKKVSAETIANVEREEVEVGTDRLRAIVLVLGVTADEVLR